LPRERDAHAASGSRPAAGMGSRNIWVASALERIARGVPKTHTIRDNDNCLKADLICFYLIAVP